MKNIKDLIGTLIIGIILLLIIYCIYFFFGAPILFLLGLKYNNLFSLAKFFAVFFILSGIIDFIVICFLDVLKNLRDLTKTEHNILYLVLDILLNMIIIGIAAMLIEGISCTVLTAFIFSVISHLLGLLLERESNKI